MQNKIIMASILSLMLLSTNAIYADSYQHFRNDTPFQLQLKPDETVFINNNSGSDNQLTVSLPNGTAKITDSHVGNNGATSFKVHDIGTYTFYGKDGMIGVAVVSDPIVSQQTTVINVQNQTVVSNTTTAITNNQTSVAVTTGPITPQNSTNNSTPLLLPQTQNQTTTPVIQNAIYANVTQLQLEVEQLKKDNADLKALIISQNNQTNTMMDIMFGMMVRVLHAHGLQ